MQRIGMRLLSLFFVIPTLGVCPWVRGQDRLLSLTGEVKFGFFRGSLESGSKGFSSTPLNLRFNLAGHLGHRDFLSFRVEPELSLGAQVRSDGFFGGNGIGLSATFLRTRAAPINIHYRNTRSESLEFGDLSRVAGLRSQNRVQSFGIGTDLRLPRLPVIALRYDTFRAALDPKAAGIPPSQNNSSTYSARIRHTFRGWTVAAEAMKYDLLNDTLSFRNAGLQKSLFERGTTSYRFSVGRNLWSLGTAHVAAGKINSDEKFEQRDFQLGTRYLNAQFSTSQVRPWQFTVGYGQTTQAADLTFQQALAGMSGGGPSVPPAAMLGALPPSREYSTRSFFGLASYKLGKDWRLFGSTDRRRQELLEDRGGLGVMREDELSSHQGGVSFNHRFSWAGVSAQYALNLTGDNAQGALSRNRMGHGGSVRVTRGSMEGLEVSAYFQLEHEALRESNLGSSDSRSLDVTVGRRLGPFIVQAFWGTQRRTYRFLSEYTNNAWRIGGSVRHRWVDANYSLESSEGITTLSVLTGPPGGPIVRPPAGLLMNAAVTDLRTQRITLSSNPWRNLHLQSFWITGRQAFSQRGENSFTFFEVTAGYRFRLLQVEARYSIRNQTFVGVGARDNGRFYVRISRPFTIL